MTEYGFDTAEGRLYTVGEQEPQNVEPEYSEMPRDGVPEHFCRILLMTLAGFKELQGDYPHKRNLYRGMCPVQYCRLEMFSGCIQGTMKVPASGRGELHFHTFGFYFRENTLLLIEDGTLAKTLLGKIGRNVYGKTTPGQFLLLLFEALIEDDVIGLQQQEERLSAIEEGLLKKIPDNFYETVIRCRKQLAANHAYYGQLVNIGDQMQGDFLQKLTQEERMAWQLFSNRAERLHSHVGLLQEYLVQIRELYQSLIDVQQNKVMSILTVVTTIFLPLTLIAGWYGMNFPGMPEFAWQYGYPAVIGVSVGITVVEILFFRRKKMI